MLVAKDDMSIQTRQEYGFTDSGGRSANESLKEEEPLGVQRFHGNVADRNAMNEFLG